MCRQCRAGLSWKPLKNATLSLANYIFQQQIRASSGSRGIRGVRDRQAVAQHCIRSLLAQVVRNSQRPACVPLPHSTGPLRCNSQYSGDALSEHFGMRAAPRGLAYGCLLLHSSSSSWSRSMFQARVPSWRHCYGTPGAFLRRSWSRDSGLLGFLGLECSVVQGFFTPWGVVATRLRPANTAPRRRMKLCAWCSLGELSCPKYVRVPKLEEPHMKIV